MSDKPLSRVRYGEAFWRAHHEARRAGRLRLGFKLRSPVAEHLERNPLGLAMPADSTRSDAP